MILDDIAALTAKRVKAAKEIISLEQIQSKACEMEKGDFCFEKALRAKEISFICEIKRASPSKGMISRDFPYLDIACEYEKAGAAAISILTEPDYFMGSDSYLTEIKQQVSIPLLRKDFTIDEYQIYEAKVLGADAVLLISALLDTKKIKRYLAICESLGLSAIVETHDAKEVDDAIQAGAKIIGINNRDLRTFKVDINTFINLKPLIPKNILTVAESGIKTPQDIAIISKAGADAILIGETLMLSKDRSATLKQLREESKL